MPELAEVETVRKNLDQILRGKKIKSVVLMKPTTIFSPSSNRPQ